MNRFPFRLGSISTGTLNTGELLDTFAYAFDHQLRDVPNVAGSQRRLIRECKAYSALIDAGHVNDDGLEYASVLLADIMEAMQGFAPAFVRFGAHDGDGADFGYWPDIESLDDAVQAGDVLKVSDLCEVPHLYTGEVMVVNDHGNVTLYAHTGDENNPHATEMWSCV